MGKRGRPKGSKLSDEARAKISAKVKAAWARRGSAKQLPTEEQKAKKRAYANQYYHSKRAKPLRVPPVVPDTPVFPTEPMMYGKVLPFKVLADWIARTVPPCDERTNAIRLIHAASMEILKAKGTRDAGAATTGAIKELRLGAETTVQLREGDAARLER